MAAHKVSKLRKELANYQRYLETLSDALPALKAVGLVSFKPSAIQKTIDQVKTALAAFDANEMTGSKLAQGFARLDEGYAIVRYTVDEFTEGLKGPFLKGMRNLEDTWENLYDAWQDVIIDQPEGLFPLHAIETEFENENEPNEDESDEDE
jgi:hypothetical protein